MKNQILDIPFRDSFSDFLEKGEKILWQASAEKKEFTIAPTIPEKKKVTIKSISLDLLIIIMIFVSQFYIEKYSEGLSVFLAFPLMLIIMLIVRLRTTPLKYAITTNRVLFRSVESREIKIHEIPFSEINDCILVENENKKGTIFLAVKNPDAITFDTLKNGEKRHQPTLENIENPQVVAKLIRERIRKSNFPL